jgi:hypothetical protein
VLTDRRRLETAWNDATKVSMGYALANDSRIFKAICESLGLPKEGAAASLKREG